MKDYLNAEERNQFMVIAVLLDMLEGNRSMTCETEYRLKHITEQWAKRGNLTRDEKKFLKMSTTYLSKFIDSVAERLNEKELKTIQNKIKNFDFRLVDDFTLQKVYRDINDRMVNAAVPRQQFNSWCEQIMECNCNGCQKHWAECELYNVFEDNFVPESSWNKQNCKYAYEIKRKKE